MQLEANVEVRLPLSRGVALAGPSWVVQPKPGVAHIRTSVTVAANLHAIQDIEELHAKLGRDALAKEESLGEGNILVALEGIA